MDKRIIILTKKYDLPVEMWEIINDYLKNAIYFLMHPPAVISMKFSQFQFAKFECWRETKPNPNEIVYNSHCQYVHGEYGKCKCQYCVHLQIVKRANSKLIRLFEF